MSYIKNIAEEQLDKAKLVSYTVSFPIHTEIGDYNSIEYRDKLSKKIAEAISAEVSGSGSGMGSMDFSLSSYAIHAIDWNISKIYKIMEQHKIVNSQIWMVLYDENSNILNSLDCIQK